MAYTKFRNGFDISTASAVDKRLLLSKQEMLTAETYYNLPDQYFTICKDDGKLYLYNKLNTVDSVTGKYRLVEEGINFNNPVFKANLDTFITNSSKVQEHTTAINNINLKIGSETSGLIKDINDAKSSILTEKQRAESAESTLTNNLSSLNTALTKEISDRKSAVSAVKELVNLANEERIDSDTVLDNKIKAIQADYLKSTDKTALQTNINAKQDAISDLADIRSGAAKGITAVQTSDIKSVALTGSYNDLTDKPELLTKAVNDLENYYLKSQTYTQAEVNNLISSIKTIEFKIVESLPTTGQPNIVYLLKRTTEAAGDSYDEYVYIDGKWEKIGTTVIDLSNYYTKDQTYSKLETDGLLLQTIKDVKMNGTSVVTNGVANIDFTTEVAEQALNQSETIQTVVSNISSIQEWIDEVKMDGGDVE